MTKRSERGAALITVLIISTVFAVLAYITLQVAINTLDSTDTHADIFSARLVAEGAIDSAGARLRTSQGAADELFPSFLDPSYALSTSEDLLRETLIDANTTTGRELDSFPSTIERTAYTFDTSVSTYASDTDLIPGNRDDAVYRYLDDMTFSEDYPGYEFTPVESQGTLVVYGVGEVSRDNTENSIFSFLRAEYPNVQWNYDVREAGVTEPSRLGPYPLIESEHPYSTNVSRGWTVIFQQDPEHPGRNITGLRLMANANEVQIDANDFLYISAWLETEKRFQNLSEIAPVNKITNYINTSDAVFSEEVNSTIVGIFLQSDNVPPASGMNYGFAVNGVRYGFDSDQFLAYYETPHPYDTIIPRTTPSDMNIQVIYSPYQALPATPQMVAQRMRIRFSPEFSLDPGLVSGDTLYLFNASDPIAVAPVASYTNASPPPADGFSPMINRKDSSLPLGFILVLVRENGIDNDGIPNYGYLVDGLEYIDAAGDVVFVEKPTVESPHANSLGPNEKLINIPAFLPFIVPPKNYTGYTTIYRPFCPNTDAPSGEGTVDEWYVTFADAVNLTGTGGASNKDYIRLTTPGNALATNGSDTVYFVHPDSAYGANIGIDPEYLDIADLQDTSVFCGSAEKMEIEFLSDSQAGYEPSVKNFGYRIARVGYTTSDGTDDYDTPPTVRTDMNYPSNESYPAFGSMPLEQAEWWYTNQDALLVGLHFDRYSFDLDPGDRIEIYNENGVLIATVVSDSVQGGPVIGGPGNPQGPSGGTQTGHDPNVGGPYLPDGTVLDTVIDLNATYGWVLVPGTTAQIILVGDGDDNEGYSGFEIDHCGYVNGDLTEIRDYVTEYTALAYDQYYDRSSEAMQEFRTLGLN